MVNYGWICPKCGRVYAPTQMMCLYCGGSSISKQTDSAQPYVPLQDLARATSNKIENYTTTLNGVSNLSNCVIEGSGVDTSITLDSKSIPFTPCYAYDKKSGKVVCLPQSWDVDVYEGGYSVKEDFEWEVYSFE